MGDRLVIIGAGDYGMQVLHIARLQAKYDIVGFIDDTKEPGEDVHGVQVLGGIADIESLKCQNQFDYAFIAIGYNYPLFKENLFW